MRSSFLHHCCPVFANLMSCSSLMFDQPRSTDCKSKYSDRGVRFQKRCGGWQAQMKPVYCLSLFSPPMSHAYRDHPSTSAKIPSPKKAYSWQILGHHAAMPSMGACFPGFGLVQNSLVPASLHGAHQALVLYCFLHSFGFARRHLTRSAA